MPIEWRREMSALKGAQSFNALIPNFTHFFTPPPFFLSEMVQDASAEMFPLSLERIEERD